MYRTIGAERSPATELQSHTIQRMETIADFSMI